MKAALIRPDGTRVELEGTPEEVQRVVLALSPAPLPRFDPVPVPFYEPARPSYPLWPAPLWPQTLPQIPSWPIVICRAENTSGAHA